MTPTFLPHIQVAILWIPKTHTDISLRGYHPLWHFFPEDFKFICNKFNSVLTPHLFYISVKDSVCLKLLSVALTYSISIDFFSYGYWDASLPRVLHPRGIYREVSFGNLWITGYLHLPKAYRSLSRPSSIFEQSYPPNSIYYWTLWSMHGFIIVKNPIVQIGCNVS